MRQDTEPFSSAELLGLLERLGGRPDLSPASGSSHSTYVMPAGTRIGVPRADTAHVSRVTGEKVALQLGMKHTELVAELGYQPCQSGPRRRMVVPRPAAMAAPTLTEYELLERLRLVCQKVASSGVRESTARHLRHVLLTAIEKLEEMVRT